MAEVTTPEISPKVTTIFRIDWKPPEPDTLRTARAEVVTLSHDFPGGW
jgi:hypothetical protein